MVADEICFASAGQLVEMLRKRDISALELTGAFIERIEGHNHKLNAVVTLAEERALAEAKACDNRIAAGQARPLEGLPITIKDSIETEGVRSTDGMKLYEHHVPKHDAPVVARLRAAGAVVIGKTNLAEMALDYDCENPVFGATKNPWDAGRVPGGSSGGEAAALAAGFSPLGMGSDYGGSVRVPSHFCGVVGLKPTWGTIPLNGHMMPGAGLPPPIASMATIGPMARTVDDLTLAYNVVRGPHPGSPYTVPSPAAAPERLSLHGMRCAVFTNAGGVPVAKEIAEAVARAGRALEKIGMAVEAKTPPLARAHEIWLDYATADGNALLLEALGDNFKLSRERLRNSVLRGRPSKTAAEFFKIAIERDSFRAGLAGFMETHRIIIGAPFCSTAFLHGALEVDVDGSPQSLFAANWPALWVNCAGLPGAVVPAGVDRNGLPIGVQIVGRAFEEETVLAVALALEKQLGGFRRPPQF